jgi:Ni/Co efflux regulator RcnB
MASLVGALEPRPAVAASDVTAEEAEAMLRAALALFDCWGLTAVEARRLLGEPSERTYQRWRRGEVATVPHDTVFRLGALLGIHKALRYMFPSPERGYAWVRKPNAAFGGRSALDKMLQGAPTDIAEVRAYLDAERGGW